ncbi:MAG: hypothetical protein HY703_06025 [Gemmatimonadetes bacterium]|nr:hypothetical protein [Gemmatimonadota bacterium]
MPISTSPPDREAPAWLHAHVYAPRRQRTLEHVRQAVDALLTATRAVSLASIATMSKALDPAGRGVSTSAILGNPDARAYYERHRRWTRPRAARPAPAREPTGPARPRVDAHRDVARARQRYQRWTKASLVERLLAVERAYAEQEERWLRVNDDLLTWRLRAEQRDARRPLELAEASEPRPLR